MSQVECFGESLMHTPEAPAGFNRLGPEKTPYFQVSGADAPICTSLHQNEFLNLVLLEDKTPLARNRGKKLF
jgi:hypothetical protein